MRDWPSAFADKEIIFQFILLLIKCAVIVLVYYFVLKTVYNIEDISKDIHLIRIQMEHEK